MINPTPPKNDKSLEIISEKELGAGCHGTVFYGKYCDGSQTIDVAVKLFTKEQEYSSELKIIDKLNHPNIIKLLGHAEPSSKLKYHCLVFALATKGSLEDYLRNFRGPLRTEETCAQYGKNMAQGVCYLHSQRVVHGDLKPDNLMVMENGTMVIIDFSCAVLIPEDADEAHVSSTSGNARYKPAEGHSDENTAVRAFPYDVYALVWLLNHLATENETAPYLNHSYVLPIAQNDFRATMHLNNADPTTPSTASPTLRTLILSGMNPNPKKRPTALQVVQALEQNDIAFRVQTLRMLPAQAAQPAQPAPSAPSVPPQEKKRKRKCNIQ